MVGCLSWNEEIIKQLGIEPTQWITWVVFTKDMKSKTVQVYHNKKMWLLGLVADSQGVYREIYEVKTLGHVKEGSFKILLGLGFREDEIAENLSEVCRRHFTETTDTVLKTKNHW